jgi:hypothetical protein
LGTEAIAWRPQADIAFHVSRAFEDETERLLKAREGSRPARRSHAIKPVVAVSLEQAPISAPISVVWITALGAVLVLHCRHLLHMRGERRWYHCAHAVMLLGMLDMFGATAFGFAWLPQRFWSVLYLATSAVIFGWIFVRLTRRRALGTLWIVALVQQVAMIYMWAPIRYWAPLLSYGFVFYFTLETAAWLARAYSRSRRQEAFAAAYPSQVASLAPSSFLDEVCMAVMAASMAYMLAGMQLMTPVPPRSEPLAEAERAPPSQHPSAPDRREAAPPAGAPSPSGRPAPSAEASARPVVPETYVIKAGDTLRGLSSRFYGSARHWRRIVDLNKGTPPHRLRIGRTIKLPQPP